MPGPAKKSGSKKAPKESKSSGNPSVIQENRSPTPPSTVLPQQDIIQVIAPPDQSRPVEITISGEEVEEEAVPSESQDHSEPIAPVAAKQSSIVEAKPKPNKVMKLGPMENLQGKSSRLVDTIGMYQAAGRAYVGDKSEHRNSLTLNAPLVSTFEGRRRSGGVSQFAPLRTQGSKNRNPELISDRYLLTSSNELSRRGAIQGNYDSVSSMWEAFLDPWDAIQRVATTESSEEDTDEEIERRCNPPGCLYYPHRAFVHIFRWLRRHKHLLGVILFLAYLTYVIYAMIYNFAIRHDKFAVCDGGGLISWTNALILGYMILSRIYASRRHISSCCRNPNVSKTLDCLSGLWNQWFVRAVCFSVIIMGIFLLTHQGEMAPTPNQVIAIGGYLTVLLIAYLISVDPQQISWRLVIKNLVLQLVIVYGMIIWNFGRTLLQCSARKIFTFFSFGEPAAAVVFSRNAHHMLAIELLCSLTLTGCFMHIFYYSGLLQGFFHKLGFVLEHISGTTAIESICAVLCTLTGGVEASVVLEPYIVLLTLSELHVFIVSGCTCMTGVIMSTYIHKGVDEVNLMTANFATYNGIIAVSKIVFPETEISVTTYQDLKFLDTEEYNIVDAAVSGACAVLKVLANIIAALIAMVSLVDMTNAFVGWLLLHIGIPKMDIIAIVSVLVRPLVFLTGVEWQYSTQVAHLFTVKTIRNEYFGYTEMLQMDLPKRELAVTTALLYGFTNIAHMGVTTALMLALAPQRRRDISSTVPLAMVTGVLVNLLTASVIGALVVPGPVRISAHASNATNSTGLVNLTESLMPEARWTDLSYPIVDAATRRLRHIV